MRNSLERFTDVVYSLRTPRIAGAESGAYDWQYTERGRYEFDSDMKLETDSQAAVGTTILPNATREFSKNPMKW